MLLRDIADVKRLQQEDGPNLVTQGSTELVHALLANDLVDAIVMADDHPGGPTALVVGAISASGAAR